MADTGLRAYSETRSRLKACGQMILEFSLGLATSGFNVSPDGVSSNVAQRFPAPKGVDPMTGVGSAAVIAKNPVHRE
jgi:hypothetical protein